MDSRKWRLEFALSRRVPGVLGAVPRTAAGARFGHRPSQFVREPQQRVGGTRHHVLRHIRDPPSARPRGAPEQVERVPRAEPVPLGQYPDRLLHPDARGKSMLELGYGHLQPRRLGGVAIFIMPNAA